MVYKTINYSYFCFPSYWFWLSLHIVAYLQPSMFAVVSDANHMLSATSFTQLHKCFSIRLRFWMQMCLTSDLCLKKAFIFLITSFNLYFDGGDEYFFRVQCLTISLSFSCFSYVAPSQRRGEGWTELLFRVSGRDGAGHKEEPLPGARRVRWEPLWHQDRLHPRGGTGRPYLHPGREPSGKLDQRCSKMWIGSTLEFW